MPEPLKSYVYSLPRHFRYVILVPSTITETQLRNIFSANLHIWGGRYNPIIPIENETISTEWLDTIRSYDPDIAFYQRGMNIDKIKSLFSFYPGQYQDYLDDRSPYFPGVNIHSLLHQEVDGKIIRKGNLKLCHTESAYQFGHSLMDFYKINLGLQDLYQGEDKLLKDYEIRVIDKDSSATILETLVTFDPYFKSLLSTLFLNTTILETNHYQELGRVEIIVYHESQPLEDLLYFWNRQRYLKPCKELQQIIVKASELGEMLKNKNLEWLLFRINYGKSFTLTSRTLTEIELKDLCAQLQTACPTCTFSHAVVSEFPYKVKQTNFLAADKLRKTKHVLVGKSDHINNLAPVFSAENKKIDGPYAVDIELEKGTTDEHRYLKFPYHTPLHRLVTQQKARINRYHMVSLFLENPHADIKISMPTDSEIITTLLLYREIEGKLIDLPCRDLGPSNAGQKFTAFLALFDNDWDIVDQLISDHFWPCSHSYII